MDILAHKKTNTFALLLVIAIAGALLATPVAGQTIESPAAITSVTPQINQTGVGAVQNITVQFAYDMNASSINADTFMVLRHTGNTLENYRLAPVNGTIMYNEDTREATFMRDEELNDTQESTTYTAFVSADVQTLNEERLSSDYMWSFSTGATIRDTAATRTTPTPTRSATTNQTTPIGAVVPSTNDLWMWVLGGLLLLVLLIWVLVVLGTSRRDDSDYQDTRTTKEPFGDVHPVSDLEGIGPTYTKKLRSMGVLNTKQLWSANTADVAKRTDVSNNTVRHWQHMAQLASLRDVGPKYAYLLDRAGVHSVEQLKNSDPKRLAQRVQQQQEATRLHQPHVPPGEERVHQWINEARAHDAGEVA